MRFVAATDPEAAFLREALAGQAMDTDAPGLMTANVWLWTIEHLDSTPRAVVSALFAHAGLPCRDLLEPHTAVGPWVPLTEEAARIAAVRLLTSGASQEIAPFSDDPRAAGDFAERLLDWVGIPLAAFASMDHRSDGSAAGFGVFRVPHWVDEGLVLVGPQRVGVLWFVGTD